MEKFLASITKKRIAVTILDIKHKLEIRRDAEGELIQELRVLHLNDINYALGESEDEEDGSVDGSEAVSDELSVH